MKKYNQAPLPFQGQKRRFLKQFKDTLQNYSNNAIYIDLFGGSGLLSHTIKQLYPNAKVVWNDFDNYQERINHIDATNELLREIRILLKDEPRDKKVKQSIVNEILKLVRSANYVDYITLSANVLFSGNYATSYEELKKSTFYNVIRKYDYNADGYLVDVERVCMDYKVLHSLYNDMQQVVFIVDPPYLSTDTKSYQNQKYWKLKDYLDVLNVLDKSNYIYFTSNKSQIVELCEWIETRTSIGNPFENAVMTTTGGNINFNSSYTDIMLYKADFK